MIIKAHMLEGDVRAHVRGLVVRIVALLLRGEDLSQAAEGDAGLAHLRQDAPEAAHRPDEHGVIGDEDDEFAKRDIPRDSFE